MQTLIDFLKKTQDFFSKKGVKNSRVEAEKIFAKALDMDRIMLYANYDKKLSDLEIENIKKELKNTDKNISNTIKDILESSIKYLKKHTIDDAALIAELVFSHVLNIDRMLLFMQYTKEINEDQKETIRKYLKKIAIDKLPYQYLINSQNFYGRDFYVDKRVLIPRYDTECLVEKVLNIIEDDALVLDIGTGSGAIALTLACEKPKIKVLGVDISEKAIEIANKNKKILGVNNAKFIQSDLFSNINFKKFDVIVSNPPYISNDEVEQMGASVYIHEPHQALFAQSNGLYFYYEIAKKACEFLNKGGILAFEIGYKQKEQVVEILKNFCYEEIETFKDLNGNDRVVICRMPRKEENGY